MSSERAPQNARAYAEYVDELALMVKEDQVMRERYAREGGEWGASLDERNTERLKEILRTIGWPKISTTSREIVQSVWLLVQHADQDLAFQVECLNYMKNVGPGEVELWQMAYLEDRIRVNQGKEQLYGTQYVLRDGAYALYPIYDEAQVDVRRREMGLGPLHEQKNPASLGSPSVPRI